MVKKVTQKTNNTRLTEAVKISSHTDFEKEAFDLDDLIEQIIWIPFQNVKQTNMPKGLSKKDTKEWFKAQYREYLRQNLDKDFNLKDRTTFNSKYPQAIKIATQITELWKNHRTIEDIIEVISLIYLVEVDQQFIHNIVNRSFLDYQSWKVRSFTNIYPLVFLQKIPLKIFDKGKVRDRFFFYAYGYDEDGQRQIINFWIFNRDVPNNYKNLYKDFLRWNGDGIISVVTSETAWTDLDYSFEELIETFSMSVSQPEEIEKYANKSDRKALSLDLKKLFLLKDQKELSETINNFYIKWHTKYPQLLDKWKEEWKEENVFWEIAWQRRELLCDVEEFFKIKKKLVAAFKKNENDLTISSASQVAWKIIEAFNIKYSKKALHWEDYLRILKDDYPWCHIYLEDW